jgi:hypothetical protein
LYPTFIKCGDKHTAGPDNPCAGNHGETSAGSRWQIAANSASSQQTSKTNLPGNRSKSISLSLEEVEASLADTEGLSKEVEISPFKQGDQPAGFQIKNIKN